MNNLFLSNHYKELPSSETLSNHKKSKVDFKQLKNNTLNSLNEVELFLNDFQRFKKYLKLYKILK